jgi:hypothetical protein
MKIATAPHHSSDDHIAAKRRRAISTPSERSALWIRRIGHIMLVVG